MSGAFRSSGFRVIAYSILFYVYYKVPKKHEARLKCEQYGLQLLVGVLPCCANGITSGRTSLGARRRTRLKATIWSGLRKMATMKTEMRKTK